jgi:predicted anti-sigma-YlaC factor YlaD
VTRLVSDDLERRLSFRERVGMRFHLLICSACRRYRRQIVGLTQLLRRRGEKMAEEGVGGDVRLSPEAKERLAKAVREKTPPAVN